MVSHTEAGSLLSEPARGTWDEAHPEQPAEAPPAEVAWDLPHDSLSALLEFADGVSGTLACRTYSRR